MTPIKKPIDERRKCGCPACKRKSPKKKIKLTDFEKMGILSIVGVVILGLLDLVK